MKSTQSDCKYPVHPINGSLLFGLPISYWLTVCNGYRYINNCSWKRNANEIFFATDRLMTTTKFRHRVRKTFGTFHFLSEPPLRMASFCTRGGGVRIFKSKEPPKNEPFGNFLQKCRQKMNPSDFLLLKGCRQNLEGSESCHP